MNDEICNDLTVLNQWHPITSTDVLLSDDINETILLGEPLFYKKLGFVFYAGDKRDGSRIIRHIDCKKES